MVTLSRKIPLFPVVYSLIFILKIPLIWLKGDILFYTQVLAYLLVAVLALYQHRQKLSQECVWVSRHILKSIACFLLALFVLIVWDNISSLFAFGLTKLLGMTEIVSQNNENLTHVLTQFSPFLTLPMIIVLGPVAEEGFFRGYLLEEQGINLPLYVKLFLSSLLFGLIHLHSWSLAEIPYLALQVVGGIGLGLIYLRSNRNLLLVTTLHMLNNILG